MHRRKWLEPTAKESADSYWRVDADPVVKKPGKYPWRTIDLTLADCSRRIFLGFGYAKEPGRQAMLRKLDRLQEALDLVRKALEEGALDRD